jgi:tRNA-dihydrouridine synthase
MEIILAPMQGLTELLFRRVYEECFPGVIDRAVSPFLSLTHGNLTDAWKKIDDVWPDANKDCMPVTPQILGKETDEFIELSNRLYDVGYDEVNWNIGCPMKRVAHKHRGSGILPYPAEVEEVLNAVVPRLKPQLSVKMRLGYYSPEEIFSLIPILNQYPLKSVTLHPRIGKQMYAGEVDLDAFIAVARQIRHPMIYNGDIVTSQDFLRISEHLPHIKAVMIGRGVLRNPPLPAQIKKLCGDTSQIKQQEYLSRTHQLMLRLMEDIDTYLPGEEAKIRKTKEYWCLMCDAFNVDEEGKKRALHCTTFRDTRCAIEDIIQ